jgi:phosphoglycerol transferase MdoB-like AlkP superfamily enzyme
VSTVVGTTLVHMNLLFNISVATISLTMSISQCVVVLHSSSLYCSSPFCLLQSFIRLHPLCPSVMTLVLLQLSLTCSMLYIRHIQSSFLPSSLCYIRSPFTSLRRHSSSTPILFPQSSMYEHSTFALSSTLSMILLSLILLKLAPSTFSLSLKPVSVLLLHLPDSASPLSGLLPHQQSTKCSSH